jgi:hypothetical protein
MRLMSTATVKRLNIALPNVQNTHPMNIKNTSTAMMSIENKACNLL